MLGLVYVREWPSTCLWVNYQQFMVIGPAWTAQPPGSVSEYHAMAFSPQQLRVLHVCTGAGFLLWELSTPFVHLRWFMLKAGAAKSRAYLINGLALVLVFFACRPVWGTWLSYKVRVQERVMLATLDMCVANKCKVDCALHPTTNLPRQDTSHSI